MMGIFGNRDSTRDSARESPRDSAREPPARETRNEAPAAREARDLRPDAPMARDARHDAPMARESRDDAAARPSGEPVPAREQREAVPVSPREAAQASPREPIPASQREAIEPPARRDAEPSTHGDTAMARPAAAEVSPPRAAEHEPLSHGTPPHAGAAPDDALAPLFTPHAAQQFRTRWDGVQIGFVDDPARAVRDADALVAEVLKTLAQGFAGQRAHLEGEGAGGASTEAHRLALRRYRSFFQRLLSL